MSRASVRLQKFLSNAGVASRRKAEELITAGRVQVNGVVVTELGTSIDPAKDRVDVDGRRIRAARTVWLALHKPAGYVTTRRDPQGRPTIYDLVPASYAGLFHVGRLDVNSEGLILLTNDGDAANRLLHPRYEVDRVYDVEVVGEIGREEERRLLAGLELEDGIARAHEVRRLAPPRPGRSRVRVTLREGRNREVRRMFKALDRPVARLIRRRYGPIRLGDLAPGEWRKLAREELQRLRGGQDEARPRRRKQQPRRRE